MMLCLRRTSAFIYFRWANTQASCKLVIGWPRAGSHPHKTDPTHTHIQTPTDSLGHSRGPHVALKKIQTHTDTHTQMPGGRAQILRIRHGSCVCGCVCCNLQTMATKSSGQVPQYIETYYIQVLSAFNYVIKVPLFLCCSR